MRLPAFIFIGLALTGVTVFAIATATAHNQNEDQHQMLHLKQDSHPLAKLVKVGDQDEDSQLSNSQKKHGNHSQENVVINRRVRRQSTLLNEGCGDFSFPCPQCGGEFNSASGMIRHPLSGGHYHHNEHCTWIIRSNERINITFTQFGTENGFDFLHISDSKNHNSKVLGKLSGVYLPNSIQTTTTSAYLVFTSDGWNISTGFELNWKPAVETFYQVPIGSDYEVRLNLFVNPGPIDLKWDFGQIPLEKFTSTLIVHEDNSYQERLTIKGVTEDIFDTHLKLRVTDAIGETYYRVRLSALPGPPSNVNISSILGTSVRISWDDYSPSPGDGSSYVLQYKPWNTDQDYIVISGLHTKLYTIMDLTPSTVYAFRVVAVNKIGRGLPSEPLYVTTNRCGGEYISTRGMIRHPFSGKNYQNKEHCTWLIRTTDRMLIKITKFQTERRGDYLYIRDGVSKQRLGNLLETFSGRFITADYFPSLTLTTTTTSMNITFTSDSITTLAGFELHWEPAVETYYQIPIGSDYEVRLNFSVNPGPTFLEWSYGPSFQDMSNIIQIPSDNGKFATSLINIQNVNYTALLKITGVSEDDLKNNFKLRVTNEIGETNYRVMLSAFPRPLVRLQFSDVMPEAVRILWDYTEDHVDISSYVIQYKPSNTDQDYSEIDGLDGNDYTLRGLTPSTGYWVRVVAVHESGRGPPSNTSFISTKEIGCGGEVTSNSGLIRHPLVGDHYQNNENCTWIIRATERMKIKFTSFQTEMIDDYLYISDGESSESNQLGYLSGNLTSDGFLQSSILSTSTTVRLLFISDGYTNGTGFELHWEPVVETFYQIPVGIDYEVVVKFSVSPQPTTLKWLYGSSFQEMPNALQIPSDNDIFSTSLINLENNVYQAVLKIAEITEEDFETMFKLCVTNAVGETNYRVKLSAFSGPPSSVQISDVMPEAVRISWNYNTNSRNIFSNVIQYKPWNTDQDYLEIDNVQTMFYTVRGLTPSTVYAFRVLAVNEFGRGPPSEITFNTTKDTGCGGEYNSTRGMIRHPMSGGEYQNKEHCTWIIRSTDRINITFAKFDTHKGYDFLHIRDGDNDNSKVLAKLSGDDLPNSVQTTMGSAYILFTSNSWNKARGFELNWGQTVETFYQIPVGNDYEVRLKFSFSPQPIAIKWLYGPSFQEMQKFLQIPSDGGKLSTSLIDLQNNMYQAVLKIGGITEEDLETKFILSLTNEDGETNYRVMLSASPSPPPSLPIIDDILPNSLRITIGFDNIIPGNIASYVIQYKPRNTDKEYTEVSGLVKNSNTVRGLSSSMEYEFRVLAEYELGRGPLSEIAYVNTSCGAEYTSTSGMIRHPFTGDRYQNNEHCIWIIRTTERMLIKVTKFDTEGWIDLLYIRNGETTDSSVLEALSGQLHDDTFPSSIMTTTTASVNMLFTSDGSITQTGFELHWEPAVETFYQIPIGSDYEVRLNFSVNPGPTSLEWSYGPNFQDMPNIIQIPSDNGKFSTSLIDLQSNNYTALLRITGISEDDFETKFKLYVTNEFGETSYRVMLSAFARPPSVQIKNMTDSTIDVSWDYSVSPGYISSYVIKYKPWNSEQDYREISGLGTNSHTITGLMRSTKYEILLLAVNKIGRGPPSNPSYVTTYCPEDFFNIEGTYQCFRLFGEERRNWKEAVSKCTDEGLHLAHPSDETIGALRRKILNEFDDTTHVWVGALRRTPDSEVMWHYPGETAVDSSGQDTIPRNNSLWYPRFGPSGHYSSAHDTCVRMMVWSSEPERPYVLIPCQDPNYYTLCEAFDPRLE